MIDRVLDWCEKNYLRASLILIAAAVLIVTVAFASLARAATVNGSFVVPTTYEDGSVLPLTSIKHFRFEVGTCTGSPDTPTFGVKEGEALVVPPATTFTLQPSRAFGDFCVRGYTVTQSGTESAPICCAKKTVAEPRPNPPRLVTISTIAYELREYAGGALRFVQVGTVPRGAPCGVSLTPTYAAFDGATITKPTTGGIVAAKCAAAPGS